MWSVTSTICNTVCACMRCNALHRIECKKWTREISSESVREIESEGGRQRACKSKEKRCKQNRKCFHYVENLVICSFLALNACCFGYWLFVGNKNKKNNALLCYILPLRAWAALVFVILATWKIAFFHSDKKRTWSEKIEFYTILNVNYDVKSKTGEWWGLLSTFVYSFGVMNIWLLSHYKNSIELLMLLTKKSWNIFIHSLVMHKIIFTFVSNE